MSEKTYACPSPQCRGKKHKLYHNKEKGGVFYCHRCGYSGRTGVPYFATDLSYLAPKKASSFPDVVQGGLNKRGLDYLLNKRKILPKVVHSVPIKSTGKGILFEFPLDDYWQERRWEVFSPPRWVNPKQAPRTVKDGLTYHLPLFPDRDYVVIVEGVVDALKVAGITNAAAVLSNKVHATQAEVLSQHYDHALWMPDGDVPLALAMKSYNILHSFFPQIGIVFLPDPSLDPAKMAHHDLEYMICSNL